MSRCRHQLTYLGLQKSLSPLTQCQQPRLSLYLQVLVPLVPLSSSTTVTAHVSFTRILNINLITACRKNLSHGLSKSFSTGPLSLRAWIWPLTGRLDRIKSKSQLMLKAQSLEAILLTIVLFVMSVSLPEQDTTRKGQVYKMDKNAMRIRLPLSRLLIVRPSQAWPI